MPAKAKERNARNPVVLASVLSAAAVLAVAASMTIPLRAAGRIEEIIASEARLDSTIAHLGDLLRNLLDAETGQRGFLYTGEARYLEPYSAAQDSIAHHLDVLTILAGSSASAGAGRVAARLTADVRAKLSEMDSTIRLVAAGDDSAARAVVMSSVGRDIMRQIRRDVGSEQVRIRVLQLAGEQSRIRAAARQRTILIVNGVLGVMLLVAAATIMNREIRRRRRLEGELRGSEQRLFRILDSLPVGVFVAKSTGTPYYANKASREILGQGLAVAAVVDDLPEVYAVNVAGTSDLYPAERQPIAAALRGERGHADDMEVQRSDRTVPIEVWAAPVSDPDGRLEFAVAAFSDISRRRRLEGLVAASQQRYRAIVDNLPSSIVHVLDRDLRYRFNAGEELARVGLSHEMLAGKTVREVLPSEEAELAEGQYYRCLAGEEVSFQGDYVGQTFLVRATPIRDAAGRVEEILVLSTNTTELRQVREQLDRQVTELAALNRELETFSYSVSHDLRAPLRAIDGFSRILAEDAGPNLDAEGNRLLSVVRDNALRMNRLIDDLLKFSRTSRQDVVKAPIAMTALVREVVAAVGAGDADGAGAVSVDGVPDAAGDVTLLRQVWANYIGNAIKYSSRSLEPAVRIRGERLGAEVVYSVHDNGVGFDMGYADKLFGVFQRLHTDDEFEGTGVGLAIVQRIVHRHGGRVWAEGVPGQGATFFFSLPVAESVG